MLMLMFKNPNKCGTLLIQNKKLRGEKKKKEKKKPVRVVAQSTNKQGHPSSTSGGHTAHLLLFSSFFNVKLFNFFK
jgi:ABC-type dipeptide/oligopeptide/nickel transport system ATPase subunit